MIDLIFIFLSAIFLSHDIMPRIFIGNFDFEHRLARPKGQLPAKLDRINAELATSWLAIAEDGDYLWTPQPIEAGFFDKGVADGLPRAIPVVSLDDVPRGVECVPWGWTAPIRDQCDKHGWIRNDPPDKAVRAANSRRLSAALLANGAIDARGDGQRRQIIRNRPQCAERAKRVEAFRSSPLPVGLLEIARGHVVGRQEPRNGRARLIGTGPP